MASEVVDLLPGRQRKLNWPWRTDRGGKTCKPSQFMESSWLATYSSVMVLVSQCIFLQFFGGQNMVSVSWMDSSGKTSQSSRPGGSRGIRLVLSSAVANSADFWIKGMGRRSG